MAHRLSCPVACGIFLQKRLDLCLLYWQADSLLLSHQEAPQLCFQGLSSNWIRPTQIFLENLSYSNGAGSQEPACQCRKHKSHGFHPWVRKIPLEEGMATHSTILRDSLVDQIVKNLPGFDPWVRKIPWRREWQATLVFLPGEPHEQRSLVGYIPWGHKQLDMTERFTFTKNLLFMDLNYIYGLPS